ncbi:MAG: matrixin family metalloprotease, partial [Bryobacteraceae bacterium]
MAASLATTGMLAAQPLLRLRTRQFDPVAVTPFAARKALLRQRRLPRAPGVSHLIVQFHSQPSADQVAALTARGATVLGYVPDFAVSVAAPDRIDFSGLGVRWAGVLPARDKLSPLLVNAGDTASAAYYLIEFYPDVDMGVARMLVLGAGLQLQENPDLAPNHLLVLGDPARAVQLANWDEVSYIFPASPELIAGVPVRACAGALTAEGQVSQDIPLIGDGWDGPGLGAADLLYAVTSLTPQLGASAAQAEIVRAFNEWAKYAKLTFTQTTAATGPHTLNVLFAQGDHGDGYPFVPGVLAHTFFPAPPNPEPIAGDLHFNDA